MAATDALMNIEDIENSIMDLQLEYNDLLDKEIYYEKRQLLEHCNDVQQKVKIIRHELYELLHEYRRLHITNSETIDTDDNSIKYMK